MARPRELIMSDGSGHNIAVLLKYLKIACKACGLAGYVDNVGHAVSDDLGKCFRIYSVPGGIENYKVRLFFDVIKDFQHITCDEVAVHARERF